MKFLLLLHVLRFTSIVALVCLVLFPGSDALATRPFWADKTSYIEGDYLYVVGKVSQIPTIEEGKQQALVHGKIELMNEAKISEISAADLALEARHTYIENNQDGSVNVYQLLRIPTANVVEVQQRLRAKGEPQKQAFEQARRELVDIQDTLFHTKQDLERRSLSVQEASESIKEIHDSLTMRAQEMDERQSEIEDLKSSLKEKMQTINNQDEKLEELLQQLDRVHQTQVATLNRLRAFDKELQETEGETTRIHQDILDRIERLSLKACEHITPGMTPADVKRILGPPSGEKHTFKDDRYDTWAYGTARVNFDSQAVVESVAGCQQE